MATSASLPFFLFTLPAGAISDLINRKRLFIASYLWLATAAGLLAVCTWLRLVHPYFILTTVFLLGIGSAFNAPVWAAIVPEVVGKEDLPSAITLSGAQMNVGGIVGPALAGFLLPVAGPAMLFSLNALAFLFAALIIGRHYRQRRQPQAHLESFLESFVSAARFIRFLYCGCPRPGTGSRPSAFAASGESAGAGVRQLGDRIAYWRSFGASLRSRQSHTEHADGCGQRHSGHGFCPHGRRSKSLDLSSRCSLGRHKLDRIGIGALDSMSTGDASLGPRADERTDHHGVTRRGSARRDPLGLVSDFFRSQSDAAGRRHSPGSQSDVGHPALY